MGSKRDLTNMQFGRLTAKEIVRMDKSKGAIWRCECGNEKVLPVNSVKWRSAVSQMRNRIVRKSYNLSSCIVLQNNV